MDFRTKIDIPTSEVIISHRNRLLMLGSCFIENIGKILSDNKFQVNLNPFGILYNPLSISTALNLLIEEKEFTKDDLFFDKGLYLSFYHHGFFSDKDSEKCLSYINNELKQASSDLRKADVLIITFGTAYVFRHKEKNMIVGNCHKLPAATFDRFRLNVDDIVKEWTLLIDKIKEINPRIKILLTVSPIRHLKDGASQNQLSKATLLLAIDQLLQEKESVYYFPSYELVLDELRDYRFYGEDMIHPNSTAIQYIWERFGDTYFRSDTYSIIKEWSKIHQALNHRPINGVSEEHKLFLRQTLLKIKAFRDKYPYICCDSELSELEARLL